MEKIVKAYEYMRNEVSKAESKSLSDFTADKTKLIIIDINNGFTRQGALSSPRVEKTIPGVVALTQAALEKGIEVLAYTDYHPEDAKEFLAYPSHCVAGTYESKLVDELEVLKENGLKEIHKNSTNGMLVYNPVNVEQTTDYIIIGCVTDICVYQYAITLRAYLNEKQLDGDVYVVKDLVETFHIDEVHESELYNTVFLKSLIDNGIKLVSKIEL